MERFLLKSGFYLISVSEITEKTSLFKILIQNNQSLWIYTLKNLISIDTYSVF
ncbi:hypothetical protein L8106_09526 [Lyngbya sp. PCC 8106]|nr:hypothetical protein L8106_09526 [Lyngbya sp. PCC 8106]